MEPRCAQATRKFYTLIKENRSEMRTSFPSANMMFSFSECRVAQTNLSQCLKEVGLLSTGKWPATGANSGRRDKFSPPVTVKRIAGSKICPHLASMKKYQGAIHDWP